MNVNESRKFFFIDFLSFIQTVSEVIVPIVFISGFNGEKIHSEWPFESVFLYNL